MTTNKQNVMLFIKLGQTQAIITNLYSYIIIHYSWYNYSSIHIIGINIMYSIEYYIMII